jgi:hypothetical protein
MRCEHIFCQVEATARLTAPRIKERCPFCDEHLEEMLSWANVYRRVPGRVVVERVT